MVYQLQIDDRDPFNYDIGYFDPAMKNKPRESAFRVVMSVKKTEVTQKGIIAIAREIAIENHQYKY